jgi:hypothetical protein
MPPCSFPPASAGNVSADEGIEGFTCQRTTPTNAQFILPCPKFFYALIVMCLYNALHAKRRGMQEKVERWQVNPSKTNRRVVRFRVPLALLKQTLSAQDIYPTSSKVRIPANLSR